MPIVETPRVVLEFTKLKVKMDLPITLHNEHSNHIFMAPLHMKIKKLVWKCFVSICRLHLNYCFYHCTFFLFLKLHKLCSSQHTNCAWIIHHENVVIGDRSYVFACFEKKRLKKLEEINFNEIPHSVMTLLLWVKMTWTFPSLCCQS